MKNQNSVSKLSKQKSQKFSKSSTIAESNKKIHFTQKSLKTQTIILKVGTNVITTSDGKLDQTVLKNLVEQICFLKTQKNTQIIFVSSGAMGAGRSLVKTKTELPKVERRQVLSSVGQIELMKNYLDLFQKHGNVCAQVLATKEDFRDRSHYINMKTCFESLLKEKITPIVNENDAISIEELMFTDNDELAGLIGAMMNVDKVIVLSNIDGLFTGHPNDPQSELISKVDFQNMKVEDFISPEKSSFGRGGMMTKCRIAKKLSAMGITVQIANGKKKNILLKIMNNENEGTTFLPSKKLSSIKRRIGYATGYEKGTVWIDQKAEEVLFSNERIVSLLPVGITKVEGEFEKDDVVKIKNKKGNAIGFGIAKYGSEEVNLLKGKKGGRVFIHYDYLFLEP